MKILLVDDEAEFVSALAERLSFRGIDADWVSRPEDAVARAQEKCYELAVLDVKMPKVSGITLKKLLQEKCPEMRFIFLTGHGSEEEYRAGTAEAGADAYLVKPLQLEDLLAKLNEVRAEREREKADE